VIVNSDYIAALEYFCLYHEIIKKGGHSGIGEEEVQNMRTMFPWHDMDFILAVTEIAPNGFI
jgi:hypothetical protein